MSKPTEADMVLISVHRLLIVLLMLKVISKEINGRVTYEDIKDFASIYGKPKV
jgi:hypothetical protein